MRRRKRFYRCKNCLKEFSEISDDKKCEYCGSDRIKLIRTVIGDNIEETEIEIDISKNFNG